MRLLLDTHVLLWLVLDAPQLTHAARRSIDNADKVFVSAVSLWEIAIKVALGKLPIDQDRLDAEIESIGFEPLSITAAHARAVRALPPLHTDPFDRMLVAQAMSEPLRLLTHDAALKSYSSLVVVV